MYELYIELFKRKRNVGLLTHKRKMRKLLRDKETKKLEEERFLEDLKYFNDYNPDEL